MLHASPSSTRTSRRRVAVSLLASLLLVLVAAGASAQSVSATPDDQRPSSGWTVTPVFVFSQSADSNVTLAGKGEPNTADKALGLAPSGEIAYLGPHTTMTGGYAGSATRYFTLSQLDTFDQRLYFNVKQLVSRHVELFGNASAGWLPTTDTVLLAGVPFLRVGSTIKTVQGGVTAALAKHTTTTAGYRLEYIDFDHSNGNRLLGGHSNVLYGDVRQQLSPHLTVGTSYDVRTVSIADGLQQFNMQNVLGTVEYRFSPQFFISGGLGVARMASSLPGLDSRVGPSWNAGVNYTFDRTLAFANYARSYVPTYGIGGTVQNEELSTGVRLPVAFRNRLVVGGSVAWRRNEPLSVSVTSRSLSSLWLNANAGYGFAPWLRVEGFYSRSTQDSHLPGGVVDRNQFGVQIVTLAPMRFK